MAAVNYELAKAIAEAVKKTVLTPSCLLWQIQKWLKQLTM